MISTSIYTALKANSGLLSFFGLSSGAEIPVYPDIAPANTTAPYIVFHEIGGSPIVTHGAPSSLAQTIIQFNCYGVTRESAQSLRALALVALDQATLGTGESCTPIDVSRSGYDFAANLHRADLDLQFWHNPRA